MDKSDFTVMVKGALAEDKADVDITTDALIPKDQQGKAVIVSKAAGVIAGLSIGQAVFDTVDSALVSQTLLRDADKVVSGDKLIIVDGAIGSILRAERVALNYLQRLSGIATETAGVVAQIAGSNCRLRDTRKITPGLRLMEKYAVRCGGGDNHRLNLADGVLIKDNHLAALRSRSLGIADAVRLIRQSNLKKTIEVEVANVSDASEAMVAGADELLLDNMPLEMMKEVVSLSRGYSPYPILEASGGITVNNASEIAEIGVDFISIGAITHSAPALDISLRLEFE